MSFLLRIHCATIILKVFLFDDLYFPFLQEGEA